MYKDWVYKTLFGLFTIMTILLVVMIIFPTVVFAEVAGPDPLPDLGGFWAAIGAKHWPLAVGLGLTVVVWIVRSFVTHKIPKKVLPWVTLGIAVVGTAGTRMAQAIGNELPWWQGMVQGIFEGMTMGFMAIGWWDTKQTIKKREVE